MVQVFQQQKQWVVSEPRVCFSAAANFILVAAGMGGSYVTAAGMGGSYVSAKSVLQLQNVLLFKACFRAATHLNGTAAMPEAS